MGHLNMSDTELSSQITDCTDRILFCLIASHDPSMEVMKLYDKANDKDVFVAALVGTLLLRHRQWQAMSMGAA